LGVSGEEDPPKSPGVLWVGMQTWRNKGVAQASGPSQVFKWSYGTKQNGSPLLAQKESGAEPKKAGGANSGKEKASGRYGAKKPHMS